MEEHLLAVLQAAVSFPVAWGTLGEGASTPRAAMWRISGRSQPTLDGPGLSQSRVQIDCYGKSPKQAILAGRAVKAAVNGYRGGPILSVFLEAERDLNDDDAGVLARASLTFAISYRD